MFTLQLMIKFSKSLEISHEEDRDKRESTQSVRAWRCRALMWVFISIQIDPVIIFSQDFLLQLLLWLVSGHRPLLRLQMVSNEAYYTKEKSCTTWQDMFGHRLPQNRCSIMQNFAVFFDGNSRTDVISFMKMMEHLKIHVQCKRHRLLFPTESQSHWLHGLGFLPVCAFHTRHIFSTWIIFKGVLKASVQIYIKPHSLHILDFSPPWSHLFVISPLCSFKCFLKLSTQEDDRWHWVHLQPHEVVTDVAVLHHRIIEVADEDDRHKILHHHSSCHIVLRAHPRGRPPCPCLAPHPSLPPPCQSPWPPGWSPRRPPHQPSPIYTKTRRASVLQPL